MTQENATQPGAFESASSARSQAMADIAKRVHEQNVTEFNAFDEATGEVGAKLQAPEQTEPKPEPEQVAQTTETAEPATEQTEQVQQSADDGLETIVIDGQEKKVKRDQIIEAGRRTLQKESAADRRLEEAAETLRRVKAMEAALTQRQSSSDAGYGNEQASSDPANGAVSTRATATPDLGTLVDERLWMRDADKAAQRFKEEFKDLADDPYAARLVAQLENERLGQLASEGKAITGSDPWEAYKGHGAKVREWLGKAKPVGTVEPSKDKAERKRDTVTVTGSTTARPAPTQAKPLTVQDQVEKMRLQRQQGRQIQPSR